MSMGIGQSGNVHTLTLIKAITECAEFFIALVVVCVYVIVIEASSLCAHVHAIFVLDGSVKERERDCVCVYERKSRVEIKRREREIVMKFRPEKREMEFEITESTHQSAFEAYKDLHHHIRINVCTIVKQTFIRGT